MTELILSPIRRPPAACHPGWPCSAERAQVGGGRRTTFPHRGGPGPVRGCGRARDDAAHRAADRGSRDHADRAGPCGRLAGRRGWQRADHGGHGRGRHRGGRHYRDRRRVRSLPRTAARPGGAAGCRAAGLLSIAGDRLPAGYAGRCAGSATAPGCARSIRPVRPGAVDQRGAPEAARCISAGPTRRSPRSRPTSPRDGIRSAVRPGHPAGAADPSRAPAGATRCGPTATCPRVRRWT